MLYSTITPASLSCGVKWVYSTLEYVPPTAYPPKGVNPPQNDPLTLAFIRMIVSLAFVSADATSPS